MLEKFSIRQAKVGEKLRASIASGKFEEARRSTHSLKGVAGNISALALCEAVNALDEALKEGQRSSLGALVERVSEELETVIQGLVIFFRPDSEAEVSREDSSHGQIDLAEVKPLLEKLRARLEDDDTGAAGVLEEIRNYLPADFDKSELSTLMEAVGDYDFEVALESLEKLTQELVKL